MTNMTECDGLNKTITATLDQAKYSFFLKLVDLSVQIYYNH